MSAFRVTKAVAVCALIACAAMFAGASAATAAKKKCKPKQATVLANDSFARVYGKNGDAFVCIKKTGKKFKLTGTSPTDDLFTLGGKWVSWTSTGSEPRSMVNKMFIPDRQSHDNMFPFDTNGHVEGIVIKSDGATAWVFSSSGASTIVQGQDRQNHSPDQLSDDSKDAVGSTLKSGPGHEIHWSYTDGSTGTADLF